MNAKRERKEKILNVLRANARASLTDISKQTGIALTTVFDVLRRDIEPEYAFVAVKKKSLGAIMEKAHKIDLMEGIPKGIQKVIKSMVEQGANIMAFTYYHDTGELHYFGQAIAQAKYYDGGDDE